ncbi:polysaccharide export outer membrane protein [Rhizobiales bacterium GAS191]|nr:polysaccharide export outer membrane protein [Rhizobiales bacterium GAS191]
MSNIRLLPCAKAPCIAGLMSVIGLLFSAHPAKAEYHLDVGDVIEIAVARVPELQRRVSVQLDGSISSPLLGTIIVRGLSPMEAQAKIQATLSTSVIRQRTPDGREDTVMIEPYEVSATVVEYRPIYVNGDVAKPGDHPYRPLMTVRQAIALSGGYDFMHALINIPFLQAADLQSDYESLWMESAKEQVLTARLKAELEGKDSLDQSVRIDVPVPQTAISELVRLASEQLKTRVADYRREKAFLQRGIEQAGRQLGVLSEQEATEAQGVQADAEELKRAMELFSKGNLISTRVTDARRAVLLSSTRKLQTTAELMQVRKQQDDFARQLERLDDQRKIALLQELQDAGVRLAEIRSKLQGARDKIQYATAVASQRASSSSGKPRLTVLRKGEKGWESSLASEELELQPGDVIEVALQYEHAVGLSTR